MRMKGALVFLSLAVFLGVGFAQEIKPVAVSPGNERGVARVSERCPTFSWSAVGWAAGYRVVVFEAKTAEVKSYESLALSAGPVLAQEIKGKALSWTPSEGEGLKAGGLYVWYVQARDASGNGLWSEGKTFVVLGEKTQIVGVEDRVTKKLRERGVAAGIIAEVAKEVRAEVKADSISKSFTLKTQNKTLAGAQTGNTNPLQKGIRDRGNESGSNTWYGDQAGDSATGFQNSFFGYYAGDTVSTGDDNTFVGSFAGAYLTTGDQNTFIGRRAGRDATTQSGITSVGYEAGRSNTGGSVFIGYQAGLSNTGGYNTFLGSRAGSGSSSGSWNAFVGNYAGENNTTGYENTILGADAGRGNTTGNRNTFVGTSAGTENTGGYHNVFVGRAAGYQNTTGDMNTSLGTSAGELNSTGNGNVFLGYSAGQNETGSNKLYIDNSSTTSPLIYGDFSSNRVTVNGNLGVGTMSPAYPLHVYAASGSALMALNRSGGAFSFMTASGSGGAFGTQNNYPVQILANGAYRMQINTNNSLNMASGATCTIGGIWTDASSRSLKENIRDLRAEDAQATLANLAPVRFNYKADREDECLGFIAEDVPTLVATKDRKGLSPMDVVAVLTKVVQEQQRTIDALRAEIDALKKKVK